MRRCRFKLDFDIPIDGELDPSRCLAVDRSAPGPIYMKPDASLANLPSPLSSLPARPTGLQFGRCLREGAFYPPCKSGPISRSAKVCARTVRQARNEIRTGFNDHLGWRHYIKARSKYSKLNYRETKIEKKSSYQIKSDFFINNILAGSEIGPQHKPTLLDPLASNILQDIVLVTHEGLDAGGSVVGHEHLGVNRLGLVDANDGEVDVTLDIGHDHRRVRGRQ